MPIFSLSGQLFAEIPTNLCAKFVTIANQFTAIDVDVHLSQLSMTTFYKCCAKAVS